MSMSMCISMHAWWFGLSGACPRMDMDKDMDKDIDMVAGLASLGACPL